MNYIYDWENFEEGPNPLDLRLAAHLLRMPTEPFSALYTQSFDGQISYPKVAVERELYSVAGDELVSKLKVMGYLDFVKKVSQALYKLNTQKAWPYDFDRIAKIRAEDEFYVTDRAKLKDKVSTTKRLRTYIFEELKIAPAFLTPDHRPSVSLEALTEMSQRSEKVLEVLEYRKAALRLNKLDKLGTKLHYPSWIRANEWLKSKPYPIQDHEDVFVGATEGIIQEYALTGALTDRLLAEIGSESLDVAVNELGILDLLQVGIEDLEETLWECLLFKASLRNLEILDIGPEEQDMGVKAGRLFATYPELSDWVDQTANFYRTKKAVMVEGVAFPVESGGDKSDSAAVVDWMVANENHQMLSTISSLTSKDRCIPAMNILYVI